MNRTLLLLLVSAWGLPSVFSTAAPAATLLPPSFQDATTINLHGRRISSSPNAIVPRWGLMPGVTSVNKPVLLLEKTSCTPSRGTILLFPGGGYRALAIKHEGELVADFLKKQGYDVAVLEYSIGSRPSVRKKALHDAVRAWKLLRSRGSQWGLCPPIGVMGFSAGGHLAARLAHTLDVKDGPSMLALIYPAYLEEHAGPQGIDPSVTPPQVSKARVLIVIGAKDKPGWIKGASSYAETCRRQGQSVTYHLLPGAGHGFGMKPGRTGSASDWEKFLGAFLK
jgi:acetyl esterase/lipase